jgi:hypothetical protein
MFGDATHRTDGKLARAAIHGQVLLRVTLTLGDVGQCSSLRCVLFRYLSSRGELVFSGSPVSAVTSGTFLTVVFRTLLAELGGFSMLIFRLCVNAMWLGVCPGYSALG